MALLPVVAARIGPAAAGLLMVIPAVTFVGLSFIWAESGRSSAASVAIAGLPALLAVAAFLGIFALGTRQGWPASVVFASSVATWLAVASLVLLLRHYLAATV